jgi:hypothetical protein
MTAIAAFELALSHSADLLSDIVIRLLCVLMSSFPFLDSFRNFLAVNRYANWGGNAEANTSPAFLDDANKCRLLAPANHNLLVQFARQYQHDYLLESGRASMLSSTTLRCR